MTGGTATSCQNTPGDQHTMYIIRTGLRADQDDIYASFAHLFGTVGIKDSLATGGTGRSIQARSEQTTLMLGLFLLFFIKSRQQQLIDLVCIGTLDRLLLRNKAFSHHLHQNFDAS